MKNKLTVPILFAVAAIYDGVLGLAFLFFGPSLFEHFNVPPPNHFGYLHFGAAILLVFTIMFIKIASNPVENKNLIPFGILLKISYCGVIFYHWFTANVPNIWKPFAYLDLIFIALFFAAYVSLDKQQQ